MSKRIAIGLSDGDDRNEPWSAIAAFEQIIDAIPNDRQSLESRSNIYEQIGDFAKAKEYMLRLAVVLLEENDCDACRALVERLRRYAADDPEAQKILARLEEYGA